MLFVFSVLKRVLVFMNLPHDVLVFEFCSLPVSLVGSQKRRLPGKMMLYLWNNSPTAAFLKNIRQHFF